MIQVKICGYYTTAFDDWTSFAPEPPHDFAYEFNFEVCPIGDKGVITFTTIVCTPTWLQKRLLYEEPLLGRHHLMVSKHDPEGD